MNLYDIGDLVKLSATFTVGTTPTDPTTITLHLKDPSGNVVDYVFGVGTTIVRTSAGAYYANITPDETGLWWYRWEGAGAVQTTDEEPFRVRPQEAT
jgi:hypothetical protein